MLIESVPCFTEYNRYNSVMELDSLSLIFFPYKYITLIRIQRVRIHRNSSDEKNWIISNRFITKKVNRRTWFEVQVTIEGAMTFVHFYTTKKTREKYKSKTTITNSGGCTKHLTSGLCRGEKGFRVIRWWWWGGRSRRIYLQEFIDRSGFWLRHIDPHTHTGALWWEGTT